MKSCEDSPEGMEWLSTELSNVLRQVCAYSSLYVCHLVICCMKVLSIQYVTFTASMYSESH